jgi:hypothetical protein
MGATGVLIVRKSHPPRAICGGCTFKTTAIAHILFGEALA